VEVHKVRTTLDHTNSKQRFIQKVKRKLNGKQTTLNKTAEFQYELDSVKLIIFLKYKFNILQANLT